MADSQGRAGGAGRLGSRYSSWNGHGLGLENGLEWDGGPIAVAVLLRRRLSDNKAMGDRIQEMD